MLRTLLKCPDGFVSSKFLKQTLEPQTKIKSYGLRFGHIETDLHHSGFDIALTTNRFYIWEFWRCLINAPYDLLRDVKYFHNNLTNRDLSSYKNDWYTHFHDPYERSAIFYLLNRYSSDGRINCAQMSKHNFSNLNLMSFENICPLTKDLKLTFTAHENLINSFRNLDTNTTILMPIGRLKRSYVLKRKIKTIDSANYDHAALKKYLESEQHKMIMIFKHDSYADSFFKNKIYLNKFGEVTTNVKLAEDLIVANIDYE